MGSSLRVAPFYMFRRHYLLMSVASYPRAWLVAYACWTDWEWSVSSLALFLVAPQFLVASTLLGDRDVTPKGVASFVAEEPFVFGDDLIFLENLFEAVAIATCVVQGLGNALCYLKQQGGRVADVRSIVALEVMDFVRLWMCSWFLIWTARVPLLGKPVIRLAYRVALALKTAHAVGTALPFRLVAICQPMGWRRIFRSPVDVLNEELDDLEASWLPVVAALGRHAHRRRAARRLTTTTTTHNRAAARQEEENPNPQEQEQQRQPTAEQQQRMQQQYAFAVREAFLGLHQQQQQQQRQPRQRELAWPPKLPLAPEPPVDEDELDDLSKDAPHHLLCPISLRLPLEPAVSVSGTTYDREGLVRAIAQDGRDPLTYERCRVDDIRPNYAIRHILHDYICDARRQRQNNDALLSSAASASVVGAERRHTDDHKSSQPKPTPSPSTFTVVAETRQSAVTVRDLVRFLNRMTPSDLYAANQRRLGFDSPVPTQLALPPLNHEDHPDDDDDDDDGADDDDEPAADEPARPPRNKRKLKSSTGGLRKKSKRSPDEKRTRGPTTRSKKRLHDE